MSPKSTGIEIVYRFVMEKTLTWKSESVETLVVT